MDNQKTIDALNELVEINNDRVEGYETASKETKSADLKALFFELTQTSLNNLSELRAEVNRLGGKPEEGTRVTGKFFRVWMDVKNALTGEDRGAILSSCEFGEDKALETYSHVLESHTDVLTGDQLEMIRKQKTDLRNDHDHVRTLRDAALA
ncbi:MAG: PA2169 family four-helix-bundle protein [Flavobacterium sp.]|nr:MAG: PA2169 family four-helix-bundle protein [Flavobacterium sp.]